MGDSTTGRPLEMPTRPRLPFSLLAPRSCSCSFKLKHTQTRIFQADSFNYIILDRIPSCILNGLGLFRHSLSNVQFHFTFKDHGGCFQTLITRPYWCYCQVFTYEEKYV